MLREKILAVKAMSVLSCRWFITSCDWSLVLVSFVRVEIGQAHYLNGTEETVRFHIQSNRNGNDKVWTRCN